MSGRVSDSPWVSWARRTTRTPPRSKSCEKTSVAFPRTGPEWVFDFRSGSQSPTEASVCQETREDPSEDRNPPREDRTPRRPFALSRRDSTPDVRDPIFTVVWIHFGSASVSLSPRRIPRLVSIRTTIPTALRVVARHTILGREL